MTSKPVNIFGLVNLLYAAQAAKDKRFVCAAGCFTWGDGKTLPESRQKPEKT